MVLQRPWIICGSVTDYRYVKKERFTSAWLQLQNYTLAGLDNLGIHSNVSFQNVMITVRRFPDEFQVQPRQYTCISHIRGRDIGHATNGMVVLLIIADTIRFDTPIISVRSKADD